MKLPKVYESKLYEPTIYGMWESSGAFNPSPEGEPYSIVLPPPNANGNLHIGHALTVGLQDIQARYHRMKGDSVAFIPGADHAGFETWVVFEKHLQKQGKSRFDFSREELYNQVWDFVEGQRGNMELQLRALGASLAWKHFVFTLDKKVIDTVYGTFKKLWDDDLIYRGERIVNYCTKHQTSFADIEVEHKNVKSKLWHIAYPLLEQVGEIEVATTRPETMLGDVAIAVHPEDERYKGLIGMHVMLPIMTREIPIVGDEAVDPKFGTGAVKVTPAHDPVDFEICERHKLQPIQVIGFDGKMTEAAGAFYGLDVETARERIINVLKDEEAYRSEQDYEHNVGFCYKCGTAIQPLIKDQWFLKMQPLAERAKEAIKKGEIKFTPESKGKLLVQYLDNLKDWNLSRQIPWGIPIPAFQNGMDPRDWIFDTRVDQKTIEVNGIIYHREEDTFDTWFSSGQWPFIVTDYLDGGELSKFYPTSLMETGHDLLDRWVARMIMLGLYCTDKVPFEQVYMHGMVLDERGQKMSKSKGNVINPQVIIEQYGSDALRMGIVSARSAGQNQAFSTAKVIAGRNFCNKLWNIARYIEDKVGEDYKDRSPEPETIADHWVIRQLTNASKDVSKLLESYRFAEAADVVYHTIWDDVADWYIEASKLAPKINMLTWVLETSLKLAHPFVPFVTETIWSTLKWESDMLMHAKWPGAHKFDATSAKDFEQLQKLVTEIRFVSTDLGSSKQVLLYQNDDLIAKNHDLIQLLARLKNVEHIDAPRGLRLAVPNREAWLEVDARTLSKHHKKLEERLTHTRGQIERLKARLGNESYVKNAPKHVVEETKEQLEEQQHLEERLVRELSVL